MLLALASGLWAAHRTHIRRIYTGASPSVHSLTAKWYSIVNEIVNTKTADSNYPWQFGMLPIYLENANCFMNVMIKV
jgi:hypothetical protein